MMEKNQIDLTARRYVRYSLLIMAVMTAVAAIVYALTGNSLVLVSTVVSLVFSLVAMAAYAAAWKSLARSSAMTALVKFYLAAPVLRIIAAIAVLLIYYMVVRHEADYKAMTVTFMVVFFAYYLVLMIFDCVYFAQVEKHNKTIVK